MIRRALSTLTAGAMATAGAAVALSAPAAAASPPQITVTNQRGCFVNTFSYAKGTYTERYAIIKVSGTGWTPGDSIVVSFDGVTEVTKTAAANGSFSASFRSPEPPAPVDQGVPAYGSGAITATDAGSAAGAAATGQSASSKRVDFTDREVQLWQARDTNLSAGSEYAFYDRTVFKAMGFVPGKPIYAHYVNPAGKAKATYLLGRASGPCGQLITRRQPVIHMPKSLQTGGYWTIWFSASKAYSTATREYPYAFLMDAATAN